MGAEKRSYRVGRFPLGGTGAESLVSRVQSPEFALVGESVVVQVADWGHQSLRS